MTFNNNNLVVNVLLNIKTNLNFGLKQFSILYGGIYTQNLPGKIKLYFFLIKSFFVNLSCTKKH